MDDKKIEGVYALSPQQLGMLLDSLREPGTGVHIEQAVETLNGELDLGSFRQAWQRVVDRHSILRTAFVWKQQDKPLQVVLRRVEVSVDHHDWRSLPSAEQESRFESFLAEDRRRGFEMPTPPLMRFALFRVADDRNHFVWTQHHILLDGWSWPIVKGEAIGFYDALCNGRNLALEPARPYRDYLEWLMRQDFTSAEAFWRDQLKGVRKPTPPGVLTPRDVARVTADRYGVEDARLSSDASTALKAGARRSRVTLNTVVQGAWSLLLCRYSGSEDVVLGTTVSGRPPSLPGAEAMVGLFINTLPFRVAAKPQFTVSAWLQEIQERHLALRSYEFCSAGQVHQWSEMPGSSPLFESILVFENYPSASSLPQSSLLRPDVSQSRHVGAQTNYAITILIGAGDDISFRLVYDARRIDRAGAQAMLKHLLWVLESIAAEPEQKVATVLDRIPRAEIPAVRNLEGSADQRSLEAPVRPRTPIEERLARIWCQVLGLREVSIRDNFFDLGGHSFLAVDLFSALEREFGKKLPLATLFQAPTIEQLAEILRQEECGPRWTSLVPIQPNGSRTPFFLVHAVGGNVLTYRDLARHLGSDQPLYGLQAVGLDGMRAPHRRMEEMAADYIAEMRRQQPEGPYCLGGSSFGGLVAYEMAQQLRAQGLSVGVLALFDTNGPGYPRFLPGNKGLKRKLLRIAHRFDLHMSNLRVAAGPRAKLAYVREKSYRLKRDLTKRVTNPFREIGKWMHPLPRELREVAKAAEESRRNYLPRPYLGRITLFRASKQPARIYPDPTLGWSRVALGGLEIYDVPGHHGAIVYEPRVGILARQLAECLERAGAQTPEARTTNPLGFWRDEPDASSGERMRRA